MKSVLTFLFALVIVFSSMAQSPDRFSYQSVIRDANNALIANSSIGVQISILQGSATGTALFVETHNPTSNDNGLISLQIGGGTVVSGDISTIDWSAGPYFIQSEVDPSGGTNYTITGTSQLLSVPYAIHAKIADSIVSGVSINETDPVFGASVASGITGADTTNWNNKLDSYTETDPIFGASVASGITGTDTSNWNNKLDSYTETDPVFGASVASGITGADTSNWNNKLDSYTETDPIFGASVASGITGTDTINWNNKLDSFTETDPIFGASVASGITGTDTSNWNNKLDSYTEADPIFGASVASGITGTDTTNWNNKLDSYTETDPVFGVSVASGITGADTTNWNNKLDSYTETDPIFGASPSAGIDTGDMNNWNAAYNWGNHASVGYLTTELDGDSTNELQTLSLTGFDLSISGGNTITLPAGDSDWTVADTNMYSSVTGYVGIGTTTPVNKLDVNGKISLTQSPGDEMVIINDDVWNHAQGPQDFGLGGAHFIMASRETDFESAGIYGDGNVLTLWSPGDLNNGQPPALIYVCDEDRFDGFDNNPHNNNSLFAYLNTAGNWVAASDRNRKEDIKPLNNSLDKILAINGYSYKFKLVEEEVRKGDVAPVSLGVLAQEVKEIVPEVVEIAEDGSQFVSYTEFIPILIEATKEQQELIAEQQSENKLLKLKLLELERRLETLENE